MSQDQLALEEKAKEPEKQLINLCKRNETLLKELDQAKAKLEHNIRWPRSSAMFDDVQQGKSTTKYGIEYKIKEPKESATNYHILCTLCGKTSHSRDRCNKNTKHFNNSFTYLNRTYG